MRSAISCRALFIAMLLVNLLLACQQKRDSPLGEPSLSITFWYGSHQQFGSPGIAQRWINILGNVRSERGIRSLHYSLNGEDPAQLTVGSDRHRLASAGDFNIDLDTSRVRVGMNTVIVTAIDSTGSEERSQMSFSFDRGNDWPLPYAIRWQEVENLQEVVQVVDGQWEITAGGIRNKDIFYDRVLAFGDGKWENYEVETTVTFHSFTPPISGPPTYNVSHAAIASRWPGHDADDLQPHRKWFPLGATNEFRLTTGLDSCRWRIFDGPADRFMYEEETVDSYRSIVLGQRYGFKHRVWTDDQNVTRYAVKLWPLDKTEPAAWDFGASESPDNIGKGSALFLAHNTEVTFGDVEVRPVLGSDN